MAISELFIMIGFRDILRREVHALKYFHSVTLDKESCKGCTNCIKRCPTEAIRVRDGKAVIIEERCIDCGECIRACPNNAKTASSDGFAALSRYRYNVALPAPTLFAQFRQGVSPEQILQAFRVVGFNAVYEVARAADYVTCAMNDFLHDNPGQTWISANCPAVVRLIQVRFPELLSQLIVIESPMELAAHLALNEAMEKTCLPADEIGTFFITPCPAKTTAVHQPEGGSSQVSGTISISEIYGALLKAVHASTGSYARTRASPHGLGWASIGGERIAINGANHLAVDGIHEVVSMLEELELDHLEAVEFIEVQSCPGGCLGGPLTVTNPFVAHARLQDMMRKMSGSKVTSCRELGRRLHINRVIEPRPILTLSEEMATAMRMLERIDTLLDELPGLDCGACGSPSCRSLAEDIVRGMATESDCVITLRDKVRRLAEEMVHLSTMLPPAMGRGGQK